MHTCQFRFACFTCILIDVSEVTPFARDLIGFSGLLTEFGVLFCKNVGIGDVELPIFIFGIDASDISASLNLISNVTKSFDLYFIIHW